MHNYHSVYIFNWNVIWLCPEIMSVVTSEPIVPKIVFWGIRQAGKTLELTWKFLQVLSLALLKFSSLWLYLPCLSPIKQEAGLLGKP